MIITALVTSLVALALTPWLRALAESDSDSGWLRCRLHIILAGLGGAGAAMLADAPAELVAFALLATAAATLVVLDLAALRLPDLIVGPMYPLLFGALTVAAAASGDWERLGRAAAAAALTVAGYFVLALISPAGLGLGDVKLSGLLGAFLGWLGWSQTLLGVLAAFSLVAGVSLLLLLFRRTTRHGAVAFGPWMIAGAALAAIMLPVG